MNEIDILIETHAHLLTILDEPHPESGTNVIPQKEVPGSFSKEGRNLLSIGPGAPRPPLGAPVEVKPAILEAPARCSVGDGGRWVAGRRLCRSVSAYLTGPYPPQNKKQETTSPLEALSVRNWKHS